MQLTKSLFLHRFIHSKRGKEFRLFFLQIACMIRKLFFTSPRGNKSLYFNGDATKNDIFLYGHGDHLGLLVPALKSNMRQWHCPVKFLY